MTDIALQGVWAGIPGGFRAVFLLGETSWNLAEVPFCVAVSPSNWDRPQSRHAAGLGGAAKARGQAGSPWNTGPISSPLRWEIPN